MKTGRTIKIGLFVLLLCSIVLLIPAVSAAPTIESTIPVNGATGIDPTRDIEITCNVPCGFNEYDPNMKVTIMDSGGGLVNICHYANLGNSITFGCDASWLQYDKTYTVTIEGIKDYAGDPMTSPYSWTFSTAKSEICTVVTPTNDCVPEVIHLDWTALGDAAGYKLCKVGNPICQDYQNILHILISSNRGTYGFYIVPYDDQGTDICQSNRVTLTFPTSGCPATCGDGTCDSSESCDTCPADCGLCPNIPEFPSIFLPITMIIGFLGALVLIQRMKE